MKYGLWRHENAFGNGAEHTINLYKHLLRNKDADPIVLVENEIQESFVRCIPIIPRDRIQYFGGDKMVYGSPTWGGYDNPDVADILMPGVYPYPKTFPAGWDKLLDEPDCVLEFPFEEYENKHNLPKDSIVICVREYGTHQNRTEPNIDPRRYVNVDTYFSVALQYASMGYKVVRIGSKLQTSFPEHENIIDFAHYEDRSIMDDLFLLATSKVFLSSDSGIWPMVGGMKKNLVLSNVCGEPYVKWLPEETSTVIFKEGMTDNSFMQLVSAVEKYL